MERVFSRTDFDVFSNRKSRLHRFDESRRRVWEKMNLLREQLDTVVAKQHPKMQGNVSNYWMSPRKRTVTGIWLGYSDWTPYYMRAQLNVGIYNNGVFLGLEVPRKATEDRKRILAYIQRRPTRFLSLIHRLDPRRGYVNYGESFWRESINVTMDDLKELGESMRTAEWFSVGNWYNKSEKQPPQHAFIQRIQKAFRIVSPIYSVTTGLDPSSERTWLRHWNMSQGDIARQEAWSMRIVKKYEKREGGSVKDVSRENRGYDVESRRKNQVRFIEVKSRVPGGSVELTRNEYQTAQRLGRDYYLYVVTGVKALPQLYEIKNPLSRCKANKIVIPSWTIDDWQSSATHVEWIR
jgi:hypothetical protein